MVAPLVSAKEFGPCRMMVADRWVLTAEHAVEVGLIDSLEEWGNEGKPEPLNHGRLFRDFSSRFAASRGLAVCIHDAGIEEGNCELMLVDLNGVGLAGPWPVFATQTRAV